jgi:hypothetical protein
MITVENVEVYGFRHALRNMRNPKESWHLSDTQFVQSFEPNSYGFVVPVMPELGPEDSRLICSLERGGSEHRKVVRTIHVQLDVVPWRGMWQELDTYKVATVRDSCSTMHKLGHRDLVEDDFVDADVDSWMLDRLNELARTYRESGFKDKEVLMKLKHRLPEGYLQRAGFDFNYETGLNIFFQRWNHSVPEWRWSGPNFERDWLDVKHSRWRGFCDVLWRLPLFDVLARADQRWGEAQEHAGGV